MIKMKTAAKVPNRGYLKAQLRKHIVRVLGVILVVFLLSATLILLLTPNITNGIRLGRINDIYTKINVSDKYIPHFQDVFGDKRPYNNDKSRSTSSEKGYFRGASVDVTVKELDAAIKMAGFVFIDEPDKGSPDVQYHYKSVRGEYVRLSVSSKLRADAFQNSYLMTGEYKQSTFSIDPNVGPSNVVIKVNLDDNNE
jgi:hypothetical protein